MTELQRSHTELRALVILAGKEIRKLNFGRANSPVLAILRRVLRESRAVARKEGITMRVRSDLAADDRMLVLRISRQESVCYQSGQPRRFRFGRCPPTLALSESAVTGHRGGTHPPTPCHTTVRTGP